MSSTFSLRTGTPDSLFTDNSRAVALSRDIFTPGAGAGRRNSTGEQRPELLGGGRDANDDDVPKLAVPGLSNRSVGELDVADAIATTASGGSPMRASSLQLFPFNESGGSPHKLRRVAMRPKGTRTPKNYDKDNGFDMLAYCPIQDCAVCEALRMERRLAVYTAKTDRSQRIGLFNALMSSRAALIKDVSATMIQGIVARCRRTPTHRPTHDVRRLPCHERSGRHTNDALAPKCTHHGDTSADDGAAGPVSLGIIPPSPRRTRAGHGDSYSKLVSCAQGTASHGRDARDA